MELVLAFLRWLGVKGVIILLMGAVIGIQHINIEHKDSVIASDEKQIVTLKANVKTLQDGINDQNAKVKKAGEDKKALETDLANTGKENQKLKGALEIALNTISKTPPPKDCPDTMKELRERFKQWGTEWNKGPAQ